MSIQASGASTWPAVLTWRADNAPRMESVRVQLGGDRIKAAGRIIGGECPEHPAFSASYDLVTDESGVTRRLSLRTSVAAGERQMSISRDEEGTWMVEHGANHQRSTVDVEVPVVYVNLLDLRVEGAILTYSSGPDGIHVLSPVSSSSVTVDRDGFIIDYPGLAERI